VGWWLAIDNLFQSGFLYMGGEESWDFNKVFGLILILLHSTPIVLMPLHKLVWNRILNGCLPV
jgi:hypothetical protein